MVLNSLPVSVAGNAYADDAVLAARHGALHDDDVQILVNADAESGTYMRGSVDQDRMNELLNSLHDCVRSSQGQHVQLSADAKYLRTNLDQLQTNKNELNTQIMDTESIDPAEAITEMSWAQYCYNAALRIGTNILSQSLIDYMS